MVNKRLIKNRCVSMKKVILLALGGLSLISSASLAQSYQRVSQAMNIAAPRNQMRETVIASNGYEAAPYAYGYVTNLPEDGKWRYIEARCYQSQNGQTCVDGHWARKERGKCEQVTQHSVKQGQYIRIVSGGKVSTCRD